MLEELFWAAGEGPPPHSRGGERGGAARRGTPGLGPGAKLTSKRWAGRAVPRTTLTKVAAAAGRQHALR
ncbi:hypothetical protein E2C01_095506 [Portunus trituberculatus]|uniref:Uncharacterized protein n=1 Tax=Portunus trituberculatus TaxID=210409 RepID=A0A5B7K411_PORTR|nr:hypothetical protein [Portunus trituberculatus]